MKIRPTEGVRVITPGVRVEPKFVVSVLADEITRSPIHTAALDKQGFRVEVPSHGRVHS